ncbi:disease resistance protein RFL1-like isoform X2 [Brassica napus]|uniref:disease resistance protein RFL1-like isoform X1 n=1 Tax=Brassica napus TaxID=3708 RepID=UPI0020787312|nr:disease resistance protein RFL1-like isoform X1 [Brassica napus]XP_048597734.1 disease resistance protein RFL1-like isoform X2 [Brassica napus]
MGGCFSVSVSCDQVVNQVFQCLCLKGSYIHNLPQNLLTLQKAMGALKAKRDDVQRKVEREEFTGQRRRLDQVQVWLTSILTMENQYNELLSTSELELERLCLCRLYSKNVKKSYLYGKRVTGMLEEVKSLSSQGEFNAVTDETPIAEGEELPIQPTIVGQETMLEMLWNRLMEDRVGIVGLYGMGGVGKTTLLTQINNRFSERGHGFEAVIWVVVSQNATVHKIQGSIGEKLGLVGKEWDEKSEMKRARDIHNVLRKKKFVLFLDDMWEKVNLSTIGVPYPSRVNGSKVAFTTRSRDVCGGMEVDDPIEVRCLDTDKAWDLFKKKVGENTLGSHQDIPELARKVAGKCRGLPLALNVIGGTMASKNSVQEWRRAVDVLTSSATEFSGMEDKILPILKFSYDSLDGEMTKSCFLYCSLFPEDGLIYKEELIEYWIGEGFIDEKEGRERAMNQGYEILGTLVRACLLLVEEIRYAAEEYVKMHDVVREMAMWIASDLGKNKERCIVQARAGIREIPKVKNWKDVRRISLMENYIQTISGRPECPELITLNLRENRSLEEISDVFFQSMPKLLVLDLSDCILSGFRMDMCNLVSLRYLNLLGTKISELPFGLERLKMLTHLNLEGTSLESLEGISGLSSLRTLKLRGCRVRLDMSLMKELQLLQHIEYITVSISSSTLVGEKLFHDPRIGRCIQHVRIEELFGEERVKVIVLPSLDGLCELFIRRCEMLEEIKIEKTPWNKSLSSPCFSNLTQVDIQSCNGLKDLTWLLFAPNLAHLRVADSVQLEEIISKEKAESVLENNIIIPFQKLEFLYLTDLPELKSIYWNALPFQRLRKLYIRSDCPKLRKLPLNSKSVLNVEKLVIECHDKEWLERVEWEDDATRLRFLPLCTTHMIF